MKLYHGSDVAIENPNPYYSSRFRMDFGKGFYTTTSEEQARLFTEAVVRRPESSGSKIINVYHFDIRAFKSLNVKDFSDNLDEWFDYVAGNRRLDKGLDLDFDLVIGPVADDQISQTFSLYERNILNKEEALKRLKLEVYKDQFVFKTQKSVQYLKFLAASEVSGRG